ncbi:MAG: GNAT family N-acetyltransferase [Candidatus Cloacimonadota bacterium]|nr:GNAT family N-acetyltransferase [Candidatus Cloacimonadota bacterium]
MEQIYDKLNFREMVIEDYEKLIDLWVKVELDYKPIGRDSRESIEQQIGMNNCFFIVAEFAGEIIGSVIASHDGRKGWINRVAVLPEFHRKGIATKLIEEAEKILETCGIKIFACLIEGWNENSIKLFGKSKYKNFEGIKYFTKRKFAEV